MHLIRLISGFLMPALVFVMQFATAQESTVAIEQGLGKSTTGYDGSVILLPFDEESADVFSIGMNYYFRPERAFFRLNGGLTFYSIYDADAAFKYLRLPAGIELCLGRKLQILPAAGLSGSYLLDYNPDAVTDDFVKSRSLFLLGWYWRLGIGLRMMDQYMINLAWQHNADITHMYKISRYSPGGAPYSLDVKGYEGMLMLGIRCNILRKSNVPQRPTE
ncbi:outer membrane protein beta-barrel domain [Lentimicrobium saccharophilum]|uniref:Outer membrane protein beta-barrel domain n=2 Tax=Lentimicrobium saccharophilum TaxID=1678841 RepID=A0A0S7C290_9BACT|nr:outer membrane protein beta-barrel domain [Lentimicrobium saccharophilum]